MQAQSHWFIKDFLTIITLLGVFYNMQEGRDGNPVIRKAILVIESQYDRLNTWVIQSSEAQIVSRLWVVTRWICITGIVVMMVGAKIYPHPTNVFRFFTYAIGGLLFVFYICNQHLTGDRYFDWRPLRWGALAAMLLLVAASFFQFSGTQVAHVALTSLDQMPLLPIWFAKGYRPLIIGGVCAAALATTGLIFVLAQALPSILGRLVLRLTLRTMKALAASVAWLDPKRKFAWFMFFVCSGMQLISNHL